MIYLFELTDFKDKISHLIDRHFLHDQSDIAMCRLFNTLDVNQRLATFVNLIMNRVNDYKQVVFSVA